MVRMFQAMLACVLVATVAQPFPAIADDVQNCNWPYAEELLRTQPAAVESACRRLAKKGVAWAQFNLGAIYDQ
ncbi:MAG: hypothetical protein ACREEE_18325, partial [Dongiaceae bacterium]